MQWGRESAQGLQWAVEWGLGQGWGVAAPCWLPTGQGSASTGAGAGAGVGAPWRLRIRAAARGRVRARARVEATGEGNAGPRSGIALVWLGLPGLVPQRVFVHTAGPGQGLGPAQGREGTGGWGQGLAQTRRPCPAPAPYYQAWWRPPLVRAAPAAKHVAAPLNKEMGTSCSQLWRTSPPPVWPPPIPPR